MNPHLLYFVEAIAACIVLGLSFGAIPFPMKRKARVFSFILPFRNSGCKRYVLLPRAKAASALPAPFGLSNLYRNESFREGSNSSIDKGLALAHDECKLESTELGAWLVKPTMKNLKLPTIGFEPMTFAV